MLAVIVIAAVVVVVAVVLVALGRGRGLSTERGDFAPIDVGPVSATDVVLLRPPTGLWGYNVQATEEALEHIAESIRERDVRIVALEQLVTDLSRDHAPTQLLGSPYAGARHRREPVAPPDAYPGPLSSYSETPGSYSGISGTYISPVDASPGLPGGYTGTPDTYTGSPDAYASPDIYTSSPNAYSSHDTYTGSPDAYSSTVGMETAESDGVQSAPAAPAPASEPARPPFEPPRPTRGLSGPPERSHD